MRIKKHDKPGSLDIKRCYLPFSLFDKCPTCGIEVEKNLTGDYLMYPVFGKSEKVTFYHYNEETDDEHEWNRMIILDFTMTEVP